MIKQQSSKDFFGLNYWFTSGNRIIAEYQQLLKEDAPEQQYKTGVFDANFNLIYEPKQQFQSIFPAIEDGVLLETDNNTIRCLSTDNFKQIGESIDISQYKYSEFDIHKINQNILILNSYEDKQIRIINHKGETLSLLKTNTLNDFTAGKQSNTFVGMKKAVSLLFDVGTLKMTRDIPLSKVKYIDNNVLIGKICRQGNLGLFDMRVGKLCSVLSFNVRNYIINEENIISYNWLGSCSIRVADLRKILNDETEFQTKYIGEKNQEMEFLNDKLIVVQNDTSTLFTVDYKKFTSDNEIVYWGI